MKIENFNEQVALVSTEMVKLVNDVMAQAITPKKRSFLGIEFSRKVGDITINATLTPIGDIIVGTAALVEDERGEKLFKDYNLVLLKGAVAKAEDSLKEAERLLKEAEDEE